MTARRVGFKNKRSVYLRQETPRDDPDTRFLMIISLERVKEVFRQQQNFLDWLPA
jgi:hypothetical protein